VYPALAVADALQEKYGAIDDGVDILYVGSPAGMEKDLLGRTAWPYRAVDAGQVRGMSPRTLLGNSLKLWRGYRQARQLLVAWPADVVFVTGGYVTVPVALAARRCRIPVMVYLPDLEPGWAIRLMSRFAACIAVSFDEARAHFPGQRQNKVWVSGYPVRAELLNADRVRGCETLELDPALKTLLVFGGSRGAKSINRAVGDILTDLLSRYQVVHVSGELDWPWVRERHDRLPPDVRARYHAYPYLHDQVIAAFAAADLVVSRVGAATLAEWPAVGLPSILVPYPHSGQHQQKNADFMVARGAAVCIKDRDLNKELKPTILRLLQDESALQAMGARARELSRPDAADQLAAELRRLAYSKGGTVQ